VTKWSLLAKAAISRSISPELDATIERLLRMNIQPHHEIYLET
jgi:hypothetical protein